MGVVDRLAQEIAPLYYPPPHCLMGPLVLPLEALSAASYGEAGGKATNLALMARRVGLPVPPGFVVTAMGFGRFLEEARLMRVIETILATIDPNNLEEVETGSREIQAMILEATIPPVLAEQILAAYETLEAEAVKGCTHRHAEQCRGRGLRGLFRRPIRDPPQRHEKRDYFGLQGGGGQQVCRAGHPLPAALRPG